MVTDMRTLTQVELIHCEMRLSAALLLKRHVKIWLHSELFLITNKGNNREIKTSTSRKKSQTLITQSCTAAGCLGTSEDEDSAWFDMFNI